MLEILAPAGNSECALAAINNGANAIYLGYSSFSARQSAENFDGEALNAILKRAHFCGVKVYVAMNTIIKNVELESFLTTLLSVWNMGVDAIILQDVLLGKAIHKRYPNIVLHLSTQAGVCNIYGAKFAKECGFSRVILARETPLSEIAEIASFIETEAFVQGALCTCFSGQCYFSSFAGGNSGNRGRCKQPCRKLYSYNRRGFEEKSYALSLSDLCIGEDIAKLIAAGVVSFKIEGRMRRSEYVSAAVRYYRSILDNEGGLSAKLSDLKRTYNRGNYTRGLAFGQDKRFLSPAVQGHLGEKVGVVKVINGKFFVESSFKAKQGDAFKILRDGSEVGGAVYTKTESKGFVLSSKSRLKNGDSVFVTTDTALNERLLQGEKKGSMSIRLTFTENEYAVAESEGIRLQSEEKLGSAQSRALTEEEAKNCFLKTDGLPISVHFEKIEINGNIFIPKSQLNAFRRAFYERVSETIAKQANTEYAYAPIEIDLPKGKNNKTAVIANDFTGLNVDIAIYKSDDYRAKLPQSLLDGKFEKYLYFPAFSTNKDLVAMEEMLKCKAFDGIYAENYGGISFAESHGLKVFGGTGLHIINQVSLSQLLSRESVAYYALSKEGRTEELLSLVSEKAFALSAGDIKLMELCYCPFGKTCSACDKKDIYTLTDENGRAFPVRRYLTADGSCRFEVYNCAQLVGVGLEGAGKLLDLSVTEKKREAVAAVTEEKQKEVYQRYTSGHYKRGVL